MDRLSLNNLKLGGCIDSHKLSIHGGGDAANVSFWLGKLKIPVSMIGIIGDDPAGNFVRNELKEMKVKCRLKISKQYPTATILIIIEQDGERSFIINGLSQDQIEWEDLPLTEILDGDLFYTSGYTIHNPPIKNVIFRLFKEIKRNASRSLTMFNLAAYTTVEKFRSDIKTNILPYTDILVGNRDEFMALVRSKESEIQLDINKIGTTFINEEYSNIQIVLITDGGNGCYYFTQKSHGHIPADRIIVVDTTGAGDGFCAGFIASYLLGEGLEEGVKRGIKLGSHICKGYGARFGAATFIQ